jgi:hypothetical protein
MGNYQKKRFLKQVGVYKKQKKKKCIFALSKSSGI